MEKNTKVSDFNSVCLKLASPEDILDWSHGEVTKPETINYRTQRYEKDGLFYKRIRYKGIVCDKCGVEVTRSVVRRERMGHIKLAVPVSHIWFLRGVPSKIGLALGMSYQELEKVVYFSAYLVTEVDEQAKKNALEQLEIENKKKQKEIKKSSQTEDLKDKMTEELHSLYRSTKEDLKNLHYLQILSEMEYFNLSSSFAQVFRAGIGAEAVRNALENMNIRKTCEELK
ncbi:MAG: DNA-directed RNA polymerase subunit beta', partial [Parcubacteria group bacterium Athens0714_25]